jgi:hypothetical protein
MSRPPNVPTKVLLATARWLKCLDKLTVISLRLCHKRTATDRIATVCRFVHHEARQRTEDARAHGVSVAHATGPATRRATRAPHTVRATTPRAASAPHTTRVQHSALASLNVGVPRGAVTSPQGPRDAIIAALGSQATREHEAQLQRIAADQRQLRARLDGVERRIAAQPATPSTTTVPHTPPMVLSAVIKVLVRRCVERGQALVDRLWRSIR